MAICLKVGDMMVNYEYRETNNKEIIPEGKGWEFWGMRTSPEESVAVWRRDADVYGEVD